MEKRKWLVKAEITIEAETSSKARLLVGNLLGARDAVEKIFYPDATASEQPSMWKPIESAPKDATKIIGYFPPLEEARTVSWDKDRKCWETIDHDVYEPTAWIPQRP